VLANAWTHEWNLETDRGMSHKEAAAILSAKHKAHEDLIHAYAEHWIDMLVGDIPGSIAIFEKLRASAPKLYAITNWNQDTFKLARGRFPFLDKFDGIIVSGEEKLIKPDPAIYQLLLSRYGLKAEDCIFIDDNATNVAAAMALGMHGHHFKDPARLHADLKARGFLL
jgi:2-haloacid dehalogenase